METVADRLRQALELRGRSIRSFQQAIKSAGVKGSSYPNVHAIIKGDTEAPLAFIEASAKELDLPAAWLAFGQGHPTPEAEANEQATEEIGELSGDAMFAEAWRRRGERELYAYETKMAFLEGLNVFPNGLDFDRLSPVQFSNLHRAPYWLPLLEEVRRRYRYHRQPGGGVVLRAGRDLDFGAIGRALRALLDELMIDPALGVDGKYWIEGWLRQFIATAANAMIELADEHQRQWEARREEA